MPKARGLNAEYAAPGGPRAGPGPGPLIMGPEVRSSNSEGALRCLLLIAKPQYIKNIEVPTEVRRAPHAALWYLYGGEFETKSLQKWHSGIGGL